MSLTKKSTKIEKPTIRELNAFKLDLPNVQRRFVWRAHQVENLWDSLMRGYPVGALVKSTADQLLDGQQRVTSLRVAFRNPDDESPSIFNLKGNNVPVLFLDLELPKEDRRKFFFRLITRFHPWGYQRRDNTKPLETKKIEQAKKIFGISSSQAVPYYEMNLGRFFPVDASCPIPFSYFVNSNSLQELEKIVELWRERVGFKKPESQTYSLGDVFDLVQHTLRSQIPLVNYEFELDEGEESVREILNSQDSAVENESVDSIEDVFVRLNAEGVPVSGDELNYSILKSHIDLDLQKKIESWSASLGFDPSKLLILIYRLFLDRGQGQGTPNFRVKPRDFQRKMRESEDEFRKFLASHKLDAAIKTFCRLLKYDGEKDFRFPQILLSTLCRRSSPVLYILLYRIFVKGDSIEVGSSLHRRILGFVLLISWFGKGDGRQRDYRKTISYLWPLAKKFTKERFWSCETIGRIEKLFESKIVFPKVRVLNEAKRMANAFKGHNKNGHFGKFDKTMKAFMANIVWEHGLLFYGQRHAMFGWFRNEEFSLEDHNAPFDIDHIFPQAKIKGSRGKPRAPRAALDWWHSVGNLRAWPFRENREDQDKWPKAKLTEDVLESSLCSPKWRSHPGEDSNAATDSHYKAAVALIVERFCTIFSDWYDTLDIPSLVPDGENLEELVEFALKGTGYKKIRDASYDGVVHLEWRSALPKSGERPELIPYLAIEKDSPLSENAVDFGFVCEDKSWIKKTLKIENPEEAIGMPGYAIGPYTSLDSISVDSILEMVESFKRWINELRDAELRNSLLEAFDRTKRKAS